MKWADISEAVGKVAPLLGAALGGPAGGAAGALVASVLGVSGEAQNVAQALADPATAVRLKELEQQHQETLLKYAFQTAEAEIKDVQQARTVHAMSPMPAVITLVMTALAAAYAWALFMLEVPDVNRDMVSYFGGQLVGLWVASVVYWIGTTRSSAEKTRMMG